MPKIKDEELKNKAEKKQEEVKEDKYSKVQLTSSKKYAANRDLLQVLLEDGKSYTLKEVDLKIEKFKKGRV